MPPAVRCVAVCVLIPVLWAGVLAQQSVFRTAVTHVRVDVVVTDSRDRPVTDLVAEDFEVTIRGRAQHIDEFDRIAIVPANRPIDADAARVPPPDVTSNAAPAGVARAFVFLMDDTTLRLQDIVPIKRMMTAFIQQLSPDDDVALVYVSRSDLSENFSRDPGQLIRAIDRLNGALPGRGGLRTVKYSLTNALKVLGERAEVRRTVVFVSNGHPFTHDQELIDLFRTARRDGIPIYTIDPRGLMAPELGLEADYEQQTPEHVKGLNARVRSEQDGNRTWAANANGLAFVSHPNLSEAVSLLLSDSGHYYVLGFQPSPYAADGKFHEVQVRVTRPGLKVRSREGYRADPPVVPDASPRPLVDSLAAGSHGGDLSLTATLTPLILHRKGATAFVRLESALPGLLDLAWVAVDADGKIRASGGTRSDVSTSGGFWVELPARDLMMRIAASHPASGSRGTVHLPQTTIPSWPGRALRLTPLIIGSADDGPGPGSTPDGLPFLPSLRRQAQYGESFTVFARIWSGSPSPIQATLSLRPLDRSGSPVDVPLTLETSATLPNVTEVTSLLDTTRVPPGRYALELVARAGRQTAVSSLRLEITAAAPWPATYPASHVFEIVPSVCGSVPRMCEGG